MKVMNVSVEEMWTFEWRSAPSLEPLGATLWYPLTHH